MIKSIRKEIIRASIYATTIGSYYLSAQFAIQAHFFSYFLSYFGINIKYISDKFGLMDQGFQAIEAFIISVFTIIAVSIGLYINYKFPRNNFVIYNDIFIDKVRKMTQYHAARHEHVKKITKEYNIKNYGALSPVWIDYILLEVSTLFSDMLENSSIRVALFGVTKNVDSDKEIAIYLQSSDFRSERGKEKFFHKSDGYCGTCLALKKPTSGPDNSGFDDHGTLHYLPGFSGRTEESFLCMPLILEGNECYGVICIDSNNRRDFMLKNHLRDNIFAALSPLFSIIISYGKSGLFNRPKQVANEMDMEESS